MKGYPGFTVLAMATVILCSAATNTTSSNYSTAINWEVPEEQKPTIKTLVANDLVIKQIRKQDLDAFPNLEKLNMSNSNLEYVDPLSFVSNPKLAELDLSHNSLHPQKTGEFLHSKSLEILILSNTDLMELRNDSLDGLPNLKKLDISWNPIRLLSIQALQNAPHLQELVISKDDQMKPEQICEETSIGTIIIKKENEEDEEENCVIYRSVNKNINDQNSTETMPENNKPELEDLTETVPVVDLDEGSGEAHNEITLIHDSTKTTLATDEHTDSEENNKHEEPPFVDQPTKEDIPKQKQKDLTNDSLPSIRASNIRKTDESNENDLLSAESMENNTNSGLSGTNIVLGIIVCIAVVGTISFGYQYWKNHRGYTHTNTEDQDEGKELQTITTIKQNVDDVENKQTLN